MVESCNIPSGIQGSLNNTKFVLHHQDTGNNSLQLTLIHQQETYYLQGPIPIYKGLFFSKSEYINRLVGKYTASSLTFKRLFFILIFATSATFSGFSTSFSGKYQNRKATKIQKRRGFVSKGIPTCTWWKVAISKPRLLRRFSVFFLYFDIYH